MSNFNNVIFTGKIPYQRITDYLNLCDILISPHKLPSSENVFIGSPTKLFEYLAMSKIVIGTNLGQIKEILDPAIDFSKSNTGLNVNKKEVGIVAEQTADSLVESINYTLKNYNDLGFLRENASKKVLNKYTWSKKVSFIINSFHESYQ